MRKRFFHLKPPPILIKHFCLVSRSCVIETINCKIFRSKKRQWQNVRLRKGCRKTCDEGEKQKGTLRCQTISVILVQSRLLSQFKLIEMRFSFGTEEPARNLKSMVVSSWSFNNRMNIKIEWLNDRSIDRQAKRWATVLSSASLSEAILSVADVSFLGKFSKVFN